MKEHWKNIVEGDKTAFSQVYLTLFNRFYNYGLKFTDDATIVEDTIQEVLTGIWTERQKLPDIANPEAYAFISFRHSLFRKINQAKKSGEFQTEHDEPEFSPEAIFINQETDKELKLKLDKALATLTSRQREALFLRFYEGLKYDEVAATMDISVKATYKIVARALTELKEQIGPLSLVFTLLKNLC